MKLTTRLAIPAVAAAAALAPLAFADGESAVLENEAFERTGAGLEAPDTARRAEEAYKGEFTAANQNGSEITIRADLQDGKPKEVLRMNYFARMDCEQSGETGGRAGWRFPGGLKVEDRRFKVSGNNGQDPKSTLTFKGRFSRTGKRVKGSLTTKQWFEEQDDPPLPAEYCSLKDERYEAKR
jgi:hypothetical protein